MSRAGENADLTVGGTWRKVVGSIGKKVGTGQPSRQDNVLVVNISATTDTFAIHNLCILLTCMQYIFITFHIRKQGARKPVSQRLQYETAFQHL